MVRYTNEGNEQLPPVYPRLAPVAFLTALRSEIDHIIRSLNHVQIVLNQYGVTCIYQPLQNQNQFFDVGKMQSVVGSSKYTKCVQWSDVEFRCQLNPLGLTTGEVVAGCPNRI